MTALGVRENRYRSSPSPISRQRKKSDVFDLSPQPLGFDTFTRQVLCWSVTPLHAVDRHGQIQSRIVERESIHDLVVIVARCLLLRAAERRGVSPLEINQPSALLIEEGVLCGVVKIVVVVRDDPLRIDPRADRRVAFGKPDFPRLRAGHHHPALPKLVPVNRAAASLNRATRLEVVKLNPGLTSFELPVRNQLTAPSRVQPGRTYFP